ncbi:MAG: hypothetical protein H6741_27245 [Alphaproteobacteria bacterium]|nr:hypothetical protein [Alphaproteobacteria bacterium]
MPNALTRSLDLMRWMWRTRAPLRARKRMEAARTAIGLANMPLGQLSIHDPLRARRVAEYDRVMIELTRGKWAMVQAGEAGGDYAEALPFFDRALAWAEALAERLHAGDVAPLDLTPIQAQRRPGDELWWAEDTKLIPPITPVVVLQGDDHEMGRQYAHQLVDIFGPWLLARKARQALSAEQAAEVARWRAPLEQHAPELIHFAEGWSAGAQERGVPLSPLQALAIWTGTRPPAQSHGRLAQGLPDAHHPFCSGAAAWGGATRDGRLVTASTGDHDPTWMATVLAFPETGHPFIHTPFSAVGDVGKVGPVYMMGHPGMNRAGLAYVHHGGMPRMIEPQERWGYGLRLGAAVWHALRFCDDAEQALAFERSLPVGDVGDMSAGPAGGFWADDRGGYVFESHCAPEIVRRAGVMGERDFLYANNSAIHPEAIEARWILDREDWAWDPHGGWAPKSWTMTPPWVAPERLLESIFGATYIGSRARNRFLFEELDARHGQLDLEGMRALLRTGGRLPEGDFQALRKAFMKTGDWPEGARVSTAHASNALSVLMKPSAGRYELCTGPALRGPAPMNPVTITPLWGETNTFWSLELGDGPEQTLSQAEAEARRLLGEAERALAGLPAGAVARESLASTLGLGQAALAEGELASGEDARARGRRLRAWTRAQVRARQVTEALA